jgi:hypothetical protein
MPNDTHQTAPTQFVRAGDLQFAYRRFGPRGATPLLLCTYFAAHMDDWDPTVTNGFAAEHDVILFDVVDPQSKAWGALQAAVLKMIRG